MRNETTLVNFVNKMPIGFSVVHFDVIFPHVHSQTQLLLLLEGSCTFQIGEKTYQGSANDMVVINPGTFHRITSKKEATLISVLIDTKGFAVEEEEGEEILFSLNSMEVKDNPRYDTIRYLVYSIIAYNTMENVNSIYTNRAIAFSFFAQLVNDFRMKAIDQSTPAGEGLATINRVNAYVNEHYRECISLNALSAHFNYSPSYLSRLYTSTFGESFMTVYDNLRVNYSLSDLLQGNKTIQQIAEEHGFEEVRSYLRAFKKIHKMTPNEYRQKFHRDRSSGVKLDSKILRKQTLDKILSQYEQYSSPSAHKQQTPRATEVLLPIDCKAKKAPFPYAKGRILELDTPTDLINEIVTSMLQTAKREMPFDYLMIPHLFTRQNQLLFQNDEGQWSINFIGLRLIVEKVLSFDALPYFVFEYNDALLTMEEYYALVTSICRYLHSVFPKRLEGTMVSFSFVRDKSHYTNPSSPNAFSLVNTLFESVRKIVPSYAIGAPVFWREDILANDDYFSFLRKASDQAIDFDFIPIRFLGEPGNGGFLSKSRHLVKDFFDYLKEKGGYVPGKMFLQGAGFSDDPTLLCDTLYASSFLLQSVLENADSLSSFSPPSLFDRELLNAYDPSPFQGKEGLFTYTLVKKSAYTAYVFLSKLEPNILKRGEHYLATAGENRLVILINNYNHYSDLFADREYFELSNLNRYSCFPQSRNLVYKLSVSNCPSKACHIRVSRLGKDSGSSYDQWLEMGGAKTMSPSENEALQAASEIRLSLKQDVSEDGQLILQANVAPLETALIEIDFGI